jgi:prepilin-type processing-associated H-X9-DG protein
MDCSNKLKQLALSIHNYHDAYKSLPARASGSYSRNGVPSGTTEQRANYEYSTFVAILPFIEAQAIYDTICNGPANITPLQNDLQPGNSAANPIFDHWMTAYLCTSDARYTGPLGIAHTNMPARARSSYRVCVGDRAAHPDERQGRGLFNKLSWNSLASATDGTSNTLVLSERLISINNTETGRAFVFDGVANDMFDARTPNANMINRAGCRDLATGKVIDRNITDFGGVNWPHGYLANVSFSTVLPPNSVSCASRSNNSPTIHVYFSMALFTPSSGHTSGVNAALCDGSVSFVSDTVDTGSTANNVCPAIGSSERSPFGVWGAYGSKNGGESGGSL